LATGRKRRQTKKRGHSGNRGVGGRTKTRGKRSNKPGVHEKDGAERLGKTSKYKVRGPKGNVKKTGNQSTTNMSL